MPRLFHHLRSPAEGRPRLIYVHLPRTGGTALIKDILFKNFPRGRCCHVNYAKGMKVVAGAHDPLAWPREKREKVCVLAGHMPFNLGRHFTGPSEYVTILRDPIARAVSDYYYCRAQPRNPAHRFARKLSLAEFVSGGYSSARNCYAQWLSNATYGAQFHQEEDMLATAMEVLSRFSFVGITEYFDETVSRLCARYGLVEYPATERNRNSCTPEGVAVSAEERETISRHNRLDLKLYGHHRRLFVATE